MKKLLIMTLLASSLVGCNGAGAAPDGVSGASAVRSSHEGGRHTERLQTELGLSAEQVSQIDAIEQSQRGRMDAMHTDFQAQIKAVLTSEQAAQFEQMRLQRPDGGQHKGHRPPPMGIGNRPDDMQQGRGQAPMGGMASRMQAELGLSAEQVSQIDSIQQEQRSQMDALHSDSQAQIKQVLTPEQAAKFEQMESQHRRGGRGSFDGQRPAQRYSDGVA